MIRWGAPPTLTLAGGLVFISLVNSSVWWALAGLTLALGVLALAWSTRADLRTREE